MNSEFWNIFQWNSIGFSDRIPIGIVPSPVGNGQNADNYLKEKPSLQSKFTLLKSNFFSRQNSLFINTKEKFGGKKFTLQMNELLI
jgi:hypothetical protein